jgi:hypothetical protein
MATGIAPGVEKIGTDELRTIIARELDAALGIEGGKLSYDRRKNLEMYEGEPFGNEIEGRSQVVMLNVMEAVEWVLPALIRIFLGSDKLFEYQPTNEQDEPAAEQAGNYSNYIFFKDNPGFMVLHDWFKDALIQKVGWLKVYWDDQKRVESDSYEGLTPQEADALSNGEDVEVIERNEYPAPKSDFDQDLPQLGSPMLVDLKLRVTRKEGRVKILPVPPEEVLTSRRAKAVDTALPYSCHRRAWLWTDLVEQGYDEDSLLEALGDDAQQYNTERVIRYEKEDDWPFMTERTDKAAREIWTEENYIRVDWDGDGIAELNKVVTAGNGRVILTKNGEPDIEPLDEVPLIPICPVPMPHKLVGFGLADLVQDLQLIKSTLVRQMLDNLYLTNNPRHAISEGAASEETYDDLLTSRPGGIIRMKDVKGIMPFETPFVAGQAMPMVEYFDQVQEVRTGISRHNQGLDPDDLNHTAAGVNMMQQAAAQRVEMMARIFGETGVKELGRKILRLVTKYQQQERIIRLTGKWVPMDPRHWKDNMEVTVSVGLGTGNRDAQLMHLDKILGYQNTIVELQKGISGPLVTGKNIYDVLSCLTENAGFKQTFFTDPSSQPQPQQPPQDPDMVKAQGQLALQQQKQQAEMQMSQQKAQMEQQTSQTRLAAELDAMRQKAQLEMELKKQSAALDAQLEQQKFEANARLDMMRHQATVAAGGYGPRGGAQETMGQAEG